MRSRSSSGGDHTFSQSQKAAKLEDMQRNGSPLRAGSFSQPYGRLPDLFHPRNRARLAAAAAPALLLLAVVALLARGPAAEHGRFSRANPWEREDFDARGGPAKATIPGARADRWAVVIDAGSTGSRVHVFQFEAAPDGQLHLLVDNFEELKPGLSAHAAAPARAAASLRPLLDRAVKTVPAAARAHTPLMVAATAGLRLLPGQQAENILAAVRAELRRYPFAAAEADVKILSGVDEGAFAWLTLNYLLGHLGGSEATTVAAIDLGGGSVQEAFALTPAEAAAAPDAKYVTRLAGAGREYSVYVHSYLGYGLMAGRAEVLGDPAARGRGHPCVPGGHRGVYPYAGEEHVMAPPPGGSDAAGCATAARAALRHQRECGAPQLQCTFNGVWGGARVPQAFYVSSYFWDRAADARLLPEASAIQARVAPAAFAAAAAAACGARDLAGVARAFPHLPPDLRPFLCLDLSYAHALLTTGFKIPDDHEVTLVKKIEYRGAHVEMAWALGAGINMLH